MAVGLPLKTTYANGDVYSAADVNDTNGTINLFQTSTNSYIAAKNSIINGGMDFWQRGTSISLAASTAWASAWTSDRWNLVTGANQACTISRQATSDTTNLAFVQYCARVQRNSGQTGTGVLNFTTALESVSSIPLAGKAVTLTYYARAGANYSAASSALVASLVTGTGTDQAPASYTGSATPLTGTATLTTTWQRFTLTGTIASTATELYVKFAFTPVGTASTNDYFEVTGVQLELGSYATTFTRSGGTYQGELAACQRYCVAINTSSTTTYPMRAYNTTYPYQDQNYLPVPMRTAPALYSGTFLATSGNNGTVGLNGAAPNVVGLYNTSANWTTNVAIAYSIVLSAEL